MGKKKELYNVIILRAFINQLNLNRILNKLIENNILFFFYFFFIFIYIYINI